MDEHRWHGGADRFESAQVGVAQRESIDVDRLLLRIRHKPAWSARLKPVGAHVSRVEAAAQRNGIEDARHRAVEAIAIVHRDETGERAVDIRTQDLGKRRKPPGKVRTHLVVRIAKQRGKPHVHRDVGEVVEVRENRDLCELGDARHKAKALFRLGELDDGIERLEKRLKRQDLGRDLWIFECTSGSHPGALCHTTAIPDNKAPVPNKNELPPIP